VYAQEEIRSPRRVVTATCGILEDGAGTEGKRAGQGLRRVPVKTTSPCPREKIPALLAEIYRTRVRLPVKAGDLIITNWQDSGIDVAAARTL
jgi:CxxC motif-containing protein